MLLLNEVVDTVKENDLVLEAGIGSGLLSYAAASKGAKVCGLEINPSILNLAEEIKKYSHKILKLDLQKINFTKENAPYIIRYCYRKKNGAKKMN